jgi:hypothetical protein
MREMQGPSGTAVRLAVLALLIAHGRKLRRRSASASSRPYSPSTSRWRLHPALCEPARIDPHPALLAQRPKVAPEEALRARPLPRRARHGALHDARARRRRRARPAGPVRVRALRGRVPRGRARHRALLRVRARAGRGAPVRSHCATRADADAVRHSGTSSTTTSARARPCSPRSGVDASTG